MKTPFRAENCQKTGQKHDILSALGELKRTNFVNLKKCEKIYEIFQNSRRILTKTGDF